MTLLPDRNKIRPNLSRILNSRCTKLNFSPDLAKPRSYILHEFWSGAFLIVYFIAMIFCGIPIFFQEVAMGQYLGAGGMTLVSQLCPMLKGVGVATMTVVFYLDIYYCVIIAWTFFYLFAGFSALPDLPWDTCGEISCDY